MTSLIASESEGTGWTRNLGTVVLIFCFVGLLVGQVAGALFQAVAAALAGYHGSLLKLTKLAEPPWWLIGAGLLGVWAGFGTTVAVVQRRYRVLPVGVFAARIGDLKYLGLGVVLQSVVYLAYRPFHFKNFSGPTHRLFGSATGWEFALLCVATVFVVPIFEELFFRGVLFPALRALFASQSLRLTVCVAVVVDGALFALAHYELLQFPGLVVVGSVLAYVYWRTKRIVPSMLVHSSFNTVVVVALIYQRAH